jgi:hypothetical protein
MEIRNSGNVRMSVIANSSGEQEKVFLGERKEKNSVFSPSESCVRVRLCDLITTTLLFSFF